MVVLEKITSTFYLYHVKDCSALHLEQQLVMQLRTGILVPTFSCLDT